MRLIDADALLYELYGIYESCLDNADRLETSIYLDGLVRAIKTIYPAPTVTQWIDAEENSPPVNERVIIFGHDSRTFDERTCIMFLSEAQGWCNEQGYLYVGKVTHWMPLPEPPTK